MTRPVPAPKTPQVSEADWQAQVIDLARLYRWRVHHCRPAQRQSGGWSTPISGDPGFPDLVLVRSGRVIFAELKRDTAASRMTAAQAGWRDALVGSAVLWFCWRPRHLDEVREVLAPPAWDRPSVLANTDDVEHVHPTSDVPTGGKT